MSSPRTLENRLILACAQTNADLPSIQDILERGPDWEEILRKVERWGLAPLVGVSLKQADAAGRVPKAVTERLKHLHRGSAIHGITLREALRGILGRFSAASVPVITLKGAALAELVYPTPALRPMGDIDLLVRKSDLEGVDKLLRTMNYAVGLPAESLPEWRHDIPYFGPGGFPLVEIHHHIENQWRPLARIPIEDFWKRSRPARIASMETLVFSHEDLLMHLALHLATHFSLGDEFVRHVTNLCDIRETCRRYGSAIDWALLVKHSQEYEMEKCLYYVLSLARDLVGADVPSPVLTDLRATFRQLPLETRFITVVNSRVAVSEGRATRPRWPLWKIGADLLSARRPRDKIDIGWRVLALSCRALPSRLFRGLAHKASGELAHSDRFVHESRSERPTSRALRESGRNAPEHTAGGASATSGAGEVAVTYDDSQSDGVGAQLQRIYGLYALSRSLHIKYVHTPLARVGYQGLLPLLTGRSDPDFVARYNAFFFLPSDDFDFECCEHVQVRRLSEKTIEHYREWAATTGRSVLLRALSPHNYTDRHPEAYAAVQAVSPYRQYRARGPVRVCIHLRRGDNLPDRHDWRDRLLPNAYYLCVCRAVVDVLRQQGTPFVVRLHTEVPSRRYTLHPGIPGLYFQLDRPSTIDPAQYALEDFETLPNLEMVLNVEPREVLDDFATADVLIMSLSSLSYLGGLLNTHGLAIYASWWHPALPQWLVAGEHGELDTTQVASRIAEHLRRRGQ
jgi:Uncharacterised nucleotidyltransferase